MHACQYNYPRLTAEGRTVSLHVSSALLCTAGPHRQQQQQQQLMSPPATPGGFSMAPPLEPPSTVQPAQAGVSRVLSPPTVISPFLQRVARQMQLDTELLSHVSIHRQAQQQMLQLDAETLIRTQKPEQAQQCLAMPDEEQHAAKIAQQAQGLQDQPAQPVLASGAVPMQNAVEAKEDSLLSAYNSPTASQQTKDSRRGMAANNRELDSHQQHASGSQSGTGNKPGSQQASNCVAAANSVNQSARSEGQHVLDSGLSNRSVSVSDGATPSRLGFAGSEAQMDSHSWSDQPGNGQARPGGEFHAEQQLHAGSPLQAGRQHQATAKSGEHDVVSQHHSVHHSGLQQTKVKKAKGCSSWARHAVKDWSSDGSSCSSNSSELKRSCAVGEAQLTVSESVMMPLELPSPMRDSSIDGWYPVDVPPRSRFQDL